VKLVDKVKMAVPEDHPLVVQVHADFVVLVLWEGLASAMEVPGSVSDLVSVAVPGLELNEVLDLAFEVSEAVWGILVLVGLPVASVLGPELEVLGY
jgi:hypothetical protein